MGITFTLCPLLNTCSRSAWFTFLMIWHASFNLETNLETNLESSQNNLSDCHHCDRNVRNNLLAPTDFNQQGHEGNWKFNDLVITIIDCDIYNDSLQNE